MRGAAWTEAEDELLEDHLDGLDWQSAAQCLPHRTETAIQSRIKKLRCDTGKTSRSRVNDRSMNWFWEDAIRGSARLREATVRVGLWA